MGKTCDELTQLPPSEALPGIGAHAVIFHNGKGFYYICKKYSTNLQERLFKCVRPECKVTAIMGLESGSPLIDHGDHRHIPDLAYRDKCLVLNDIRQKLSLQDISIPAVLQEVLYSLEDEDESQETPIVMDEIEDHLPSSNFEHIAAEDDFQYIVKQEPADIDVDSTEDTETPDDDTNGDFQLIDINSKNDVWKEINSISRASENKQIFNNPSSPKIKNYFSLRNCDKTVAPKQPSAEVEEINTISRPSRSKQDFNKPSYPILRGHFSQRDCFKRPSAITKQPSAKVKGNIAKSKARKNNLKNQHKKMHREWCYTTFDKCRALKAVRQGMTITEASKIYSIPRSSLADWVANRRIYLMPEEEEVLVEKLTSMLIDGFPLSKEQLVSIAIDHINSIRSIRTSPSLVKSWLVKFLRRHPVIESRVTDDFLTEEQLTSWLCDDETDLGNSNLTM